ncbi:MAG: glycosyltransferase family 4 protein [Desulfurivibrio sp.]|nr:glycosyltransferase family 4 protein [Desulfurivibrio sp.]MBU3937718.1 glycosyltransferase family 4 protein [Pseudomonadota bacterium]MBU4117847.1 glycosyltransferase family 4 protein [Pseudomonadota bacterium]
MMELLLPVMISLVVAWGVAAWVCRRAEYLRLVDPPNHRSSHVAPTPRGGGLGIVLAGVVSGSWLVLAQASGDVRFFVVLVLSLLIAVVGLWDDIRSLPAIVRFGVHVAVCGGLLVVLGGLPVGIVSDKSAFWFLPSADGGVFGGWIVSAFLLLAGVWWINLFNFMDGIDSLAGQQAVFMLVAAAVLSFFAHPAAASHPVWLWMLCLAAATVGFLFLNWPPARIFMGDVGSTYLAFMIVFFSLATVRAGWLGYPAWLILAAVFVADATVTLLRRMGHGERWHEAHRTHAYQLLARRLGGHRPVTLLAVGINIFWLAPLAWVCLDVLPAWEWGLVGLAYAPLVLGSVFVGAGRREYGSRSSKGTG